MNVLSIDIDYAFSPDISKFDDFVIGSKITPSQEWQDLSFKGFKKPSVNLKKLDVLTSVYSSALPNANEVHFINDHHEVVSYLNRDIKYNIINFDHHHDIFYPDWHTLEKLDEGNWVGWMDQLGLISSYTWYKNEDSEELDSTVNLSCNYYKELYNDQTLPEFDIIFVCSSPNWIHEDNIYIVDVFKKGFSDGKIRL